MLPNMFEKSRVFKYFFWVYKNICMCIFTWKESFYSKHVIGYTSIEKFRLGENGI
jgi:uncharacterized membrane protein YobD (UPF0266 family)